MQADAASPGAGRLQLHRVRVPRSGRPVQGQEEAPAGPAEHAQVRTQHTSFTRRMNEMIIYHAHEKPFTQEYACSHTDTAQGLMGRKKAACNTVRGTVNYTHTYTHTHISHIHTHTQSGDKWEAELQATMKEGHLESGPERMDRVFP